MVRVTDRGRDVSLFVAIWNSFIAFAVVLRQHAASIQTLRLSSHLTISSSPAEVFYFLFSLASVFYCRWNRISAHTVVITPPLCDLPLRVASSNNCVSTAPVGICTYLTTDPLMKQFLMAIYIVKHRHQISTTFVQVVVDRLEEDSPYEEIVLDRRP